MDFLYNLQKLSYIKLKPKKQEEIKKDFKKILDFVYDIKKLKIKKHKDIEKLSINERKNVLRKDKKTNIYFDKNIIFKNFPFKKEKFVKVVKILKRK